MYSVLIKGASLLYNRMYVYVLWSSQRGFLIIDTKYLIEKYKEYNYV